MAAKICSKSFLDRTGASGLQSANGLLPLVVLTFSTLCFVCFLVHFILLAPTQRKHTFLFHVHIYRFVQKHGPRHFFRDIVDGLPFRYNYTATLKCSDDYVFVPNDKTHMMQALSGQMPLMFCPPHFPRGSIRESELERIRLQNEFAQAVAAEHLVS